MKKPLAKRQKAWYNKLEGSGFNAIHPGCFMPFIRLRNAIHPQVNCSALTIE